MVKWHGLIFAINFDIHVILHMMYMYMYKANWHFSTSCALCGKDMYMCCTMSCFLQLLTDTASSGGFPNFIISIAQRLYGSSANQTIVRFNDFTNISAYLLQKVKKR